MKQPGRRLTTEFGLGGGAHPVEVARHMRVVMGRRVGEFVPAVIARVEQHDLEVAQKTAPKIDVAVGREAVAVADDEPRPLRAAVPPHADRRAAGAGYVDNSLRRRKLRNWPYPSPIAVWRSRARASP